MNKLTFAGHETFQCRNFWLKKGFDFISLGGGFNNEDAILELGVGKNMVTSINYWLKAFSIRDLQGLPTKLAFNLFWEKGWDPYLEDEGSLWLLHYSLIKAEFASIYSLVFKDFRKSRVASQFTTNQLFKFLLKEAEKTNTFVAESTLKNDIKVFIKTYLAENLQGKSMEDDLSSIFIELNLLSRANEANSEDGALYYINVSEREEIPSPILLFCILDSFPNEESISFDSIQEQIADTFACNAEGLETHIQALCEGAYVVYKEDAGRKEIQIKGNPDKWQILEEYYNG
jgi:hypothetical protein